MTPTQRAAAERLADALEGSFEPARVAAGARLREVLAEPVQEPNPLAGTMATTE